MERSLLTGTMARVPGPVTVVTTIDGDGKRWGFTASSFSSVSLDPPLVSVCLDKSASTHAAFATARHFLINVLTEEQHAVARRFATSGIDRFAAGDMETCELGLPGLHLAGVRVACSMHSAVDAGDHTILLGCVEETYTSDRTPLVYYNRAFARPTPNASRAEQDFSACHIADW
ncbi:flavin reductase family protein [Streptomyces sp. G-G2]|uniref:flavin reductase family protein n=1 Tax=Streptomyces sp. G-G2 TaxID=3046201 RepID=UPI0024B90974|nr:flavin reductase family protein [Streptomyces sp. G-G2]MDJ0382908.1 flavin reductase family protein [Streptomyces sp. G-G2]